MQTLSDIRQLFLNYYQKHHHEVVESGSLIPRHDPSLMFTAAGMVPFKNVFTGAEKRPYSRATSSQKCLRAGGKHNDLENVGYTARHHTFFEMLGNFSFGNYFKEEAIVYAWTFLTKELQIPPQRLWITVYKDDDDSALLWKKLTGFSDDRIIRKGSKDNFWSMGDTGPCGPCTEIFYDHGDTVPGGPPGSDDEDGDRFVEVWNLVFMQFDQQKHKDGTWSRQPLPSPSVDGGMGIERLSAVLQGVHDNYQIDLFQSLIQTTEDLFHTACHRQNKASFRVIADHMRAISFLLAEGLMPSNEGRGYVLRRIMRRAMRHCHILGVQEPLLCQLVSPLVSLMGDHFAELGKAQGFIEEQVRIEEVRFQRTLTRGLEILEEETAGMKAGDKLSGSVAFRLYDTFGFPLDLTQDALKSKNIAVDDQGFATAMEQQKTAARASWSGSGEDKIPEVFYTAHDVCPPTEFLGYDTDISVSEILFLVAGQERVHTLDPGQKGYAILDKTPFYAESGGQVGDTGVFQKNSEMTAQVLRTLKGPHKLFLHEVVAGKDGLKVGQRITGIVHSFERTKLRANHSATHLLHAALRQHFGQNVVQKGSLVSPQRLRFDFSFSRPLSLKEIHTIERTIQAEIRRNTEVTTEVLSPQEAEEKGAIGLFGEKYEDKVRVVSMGADKTDTPLVFSKELCGGTHVKRTGDIGSFTVISESGVAAGIRRLEALTGDEAQAHIHQQQKTLMNIAKALRSPPEDLENRIQKLIDDRKGLEKQVSTLKMAKSTGSDPGHSLKKVGQINFLFQTLQDVPPKDLKGRVDQLKSQMKSGVILLISQKGPRLTVVIGVTKDLTHKVSAVDVIKRATGILGGKGGGGRPDLAQGGGSDPSQISKVESDITSYLENEV